MISKKQALNIEIALLKQNKTKTQFAKELGFSRQTLNSLMTRKTESKDKEHQLLQWLMENM